MDTDSFDVLPAFAVFGNGSATSVDDAAHPCIGSICTEENPANLFADDLSSAVMRFCSLMCETPEDCNGGGIGCRIKQ